MGCHALLIQHSSEILIKGKVVVQSYILFIYLFYFLTVVDLCRLSLVAGTLFIIRATREAWFWPGRGPNAAVLSTAGRFEKQASWDAP